MKIVKLTEKDRDACWKLSADQAKELKQYASQDVYDVHFTREVFDKLFDSVYDKKTQGVIFGALIDDDLVGVLVGRVKQEANGNVGCVENIYIVPEHRRKGYAKALYEKFLNWIRKHKLKYCQLTVLAKNPARQIYEKWGFEVDELQMTKKL